MMTATAMHAARRCVREAVEQGEGRGGDWTAWHALAEGKQPDAKVEATYDRLIDAPICCMVVETELEPSDAPGPPAFRVKIEPDIHWSMVGVTVELSDGRSASLWGIESDAGSYFEEVVHDLVHQALTEKT